MAKMTSNYIIIGLLIIFIILFFSRFGSFREGASKGAKVSACNCTNGKVCKTVNGRNQCVRE